MNACQYHYDMPAILHRYVSYDGVNIALQQDFSYSTTWSGSPQSWTSKTTTVTTTDLVTRLVSTTVYTYSPISSPIQPNDWSLYHAQIPVENTVVTKNSGGTVLRTVAKTWLDQYELGTEQVTLDDGKVSKTVFTYGAGAQVTSKSEYAFGSGSAGPLMRKTVTNYQTFAATPIYPGGVSIFDKPCQSIVYDSSGTTSVAESDFFYDGSTSSTPCSTATTSDAHWKRLVH